jgi:hypothetical protein
MSLVGRYKLFLCSWDMAMKICSFERTFKIMGETILQLLQMLFSILTKMIINQWSACYLGLLWICMLRHKRQTWNYDKHVSLLVSSCMNKLCQINRAKNSFDTKTLSEVISSLVISKMVYCSSVWSNTSASNVKKVQSIQNFACKIITKSRKYDHVTPLLRELNWLPVDKLLYFRDASLTYKCVNNLAPDYLCNKLIKRSSIHDCRTRTHDSLQIPLFKTAAGQRSFAYRAVHIRVR